MSRPPQQTSAAGAFSTIERQEPAIARTTGRHTVAESVNGGRLRSGRPPKFTREQIFQTALDIIDKHGREELTMRNLAEALGTGTTTLYDYVKNKEEVLQGLEAFLFDPLAANLDPESPWEQQLVKALRRLRAIQRAHPGFVEVLTGQAVPGPALDRVRDRLLGVLRQAGFSRQDAAYVLAVVVNYALGFSITDRARTSVRQPQEIDRMRNLPPGGYPHLTDMATEWANHDPERAFELGLNVLIHGLKNAHESGTLHVPDAPDGDRPDHPPSP